MAIEVEVVQDGAVFFVFSLGKAHNPVHAPNHASDHDLEGAKAAREWFIEHHCKMLGLNPTFV